MANQITTADLLRVQDAITGTVRHEVGQAREEFRTEIRELRELQDEQTVEVVRQGRELARLDERTKITARGLLSGLSRKQKAALWTAAFGAGGVVFDGARHIAAMLIALWAKGVRP